jgi:cellulose synthase/poly-beta-1,6-N-acetylglucosamine synthase-like glycosyltransferase
MDRFIAGFFELGRWSILLYFLTMNLLNLVLIIRAFLATRRYQEEVEADQLLGHFETLHVKPITLLCPAHNEGASIVAAVKSLLGLRYPKFQVVVVNDGSQDDTLQKLIEAFRLRPSRRVVRLVLPTARIRGVYESPFIPRLVVVDKENGGKADALNCGLNVATYPLVCCMDGDSLLENEALLKITRPFLDRPHVVATAGVVRPLNGCRVTPMGIQDAALPKSWLARMQVVEYLRSFLFGRMGLSSLGGMFIVSGAFGVFRKDLLFELGGFHKTIGEDFEMVVRLHLHLKAKGQPYQIVMVPDSVCWTEVPEDPGTLRRQRNRWQRGLMDTLWIHREMAFNAGFGAVGLFSMPYFLLFEAAAPAIEAVGYLAFLHALAQGRVHGAFALAFICLAMLLGVLNSHMAILFEQHSRHTFKRRMDWVLLLLCGFLENFGYRQRTVLWRLSGTIDWLRGKKGWGHMRRKGIAS